jgi:hypothetical protein
LLETHTVQLVATYRRIADLANAELERRLVESPEEIATRDLTVVSGVAADKIAKLEGSEPGRDADLVGALLARLQTVNASITLEVCAVGSRALATGDSSTASSTAGAMARPMSFSSRRSSSSDSPP